MTSVVVALTVLALVWRLICWCCRGTPEELKKQQDDVVNLD
jgi:hypothetical protein